MKSIQVQRAELSMEDRLIRFRLWVPRGKVSELTEAIVQAERTRAVLEPRCSALSQVPR